MLKETTNLLIYKEVSVFQGFSIKDDNNNNKIPQFTALLPALINFNAKTKSLSHLV